MKDAMDGFMAVFVPVALYVMIHLVINASTQSSPVRRARLKNLFDIVWGLMVITGLLYLGATMLLGG